jgi:hypothetical protein
MPTAPGFVRLNVNLTGVEGSVWRVLLRAYQRTRESRVQFLLLHASVGMGGQPGAFDASCLAWLMSGFL